MNLFRTTTIEIKMVLKTYKKNYDQISFLMPHVSQ